jgi:hypothetical protein
MRKAVIGVVELACGIFAVPDVAIAPNVLPCRVARNLIHRTAQGRRGLRLLAGFLISSFEPWAPMGRAHRGPQDAGDFVG